MQNSRLYGVELDSITGRIAKKLYPQADITVAGFETTDRRDFYDLAVGNVPFGQYKVNDKAYNKLGFSIHNYFFAKAIDQSASGRHRGVRYQPLHHGQQGQHCPQAHCRAEPICWGANPSAQQRFPAPMLVPMLFRTLIFLQKRDRPIDHEPNWVQLGKTEDGFAINQYFVGHPEMVLGRN